MRINAKKNSREKLKIFYQEKVMGEGGRAKEREEEKKFYEKNED